MSNWKDIFIKQMDTINFWKNLFQNDPKRMLLDASDAATICKRSQIDLLNELYEEMPDNDSKGIIENKINKISNLDYSGLSFGIK